MATTTTMTTPTNAGESTTNANPDVNQMQRTEVTVMNANLSESTHQSIRNVNAEPAEPVDQAPDTRCVNPIYYVRVTKL